ncbi:MAG: GH3 auxin-responsive promoter family protein, partial [Promethearchaeota archaeon]
DRRHPTSYLDYLKALDIFLQEANDVYRYFRLDIGILKAPKLWILHAGSFSEALDKKSRQGAPREQFKLPHLTDNSSFLKEFEDKVNKEF